MYVDWDCDEYCNDCTASKLSGSRNSVKERDLCQRWGPTDRGTMRISSARTVVDLKGRIMVWIIPNAISPYFQVKHLLPTVYRTQVNISSLYLRVASTKLHSVFRILLLPTSRKRTPQVNVPPGECSASASTKTCVTFGVVL